MAKSKRFSLGRTGIILTIIRHYDGPMHFPYYNGRWYIGTPNRMFEFDPLSSSELRRICTLYPINEDTLNSLIWFAGQHPNEHQFMAL